MKIRSRVRAGALIENHNRAKLKIRSGVKAGALVENHNRALL